MTTRARKMLWEHKVKLAPLGKGPWLCQDNEIKDSAENLLFLPKHSPRV